MSDNQSNECKCLGAKKAKMLEKEISELKSIVDKLNKEIELLRKAIKR